MLKKLSAQEINSILMVHSTSSTNFNILVEESLPSTNDYLLEMLAKNAQGMPKTALLANMQTAGKGRQGRTWISVPGNISLSVYWPFQCAHENLYGLSLVIGIVVARVLYKIGLVDIKLKWPNDIYWHNQKMGGILIETKQTKPGVIDAIIGIGLNIVSMDKSAAAIDQKNVALEDALQQEVDRNKLVALILIELNSVLQQFMQEGFNAFIADWQKFDSKLLSASQDMDLISKIINADKNRPQ